MKKRNLKNLRLNKKSISNLQEMKGGRDESLSTIVPFCFTTLSCVLICVTKLGCDDEIRKP
ncbi:hypothetical protein [Kordia jejudonensis]|uniref:hypothetical protein n=1 Tax=Kordia jejudonensis TaxID=1348245 RepID=UPI000629647F|nr:hypothetical protein [Kordia jejudonensis]